MPISGEHWGHMKIVAAAGSVELVDLPDEDAVTAAGRLIDYAPERIQDDFKLCCAYHIYRSLLIEAVEKNDVGQIYNAQLALMGLI